MTQEDQQEWKKMIREILVSSELKYGCRLTDWEINFLESLVKMPEEMYISEKQGAIVERIYKEKMP